jgi:hypothetical protein
MRTSIPCSDDALYKLQKVTLAHGVLMKLTGIAAQCSVVVTLSATMETDTVIDPSPGCFPMSFFQWTNALVNEL